MMELLLGFGFGFFFSAYIFNDKMRTWVNDHLNAEKRRRRKLEGQWRKRGDKE